MFRPWCLALLIATALPGWAIAHPEIEAQIEILTAELEQRPGDAELLIRRADLYRRHGSLESARDDLEAAALNSPPPELDFYRGRLLLDAGEPGSATLAFNRYLLARPEHVKTLILRAQALIELDQFPEAAADLALAIDTSEFPSPSLFLQRVAALAWAGASYWPDALNTAEQGLKRFPGEISLLGAATDLSLAMNNLPAAGEYLERPPAGVRRLPQWDARVKLSRGLAAAGPAEAQVLLEQARRSLLDNTEP